MNQVTVILVEPQYRGNVGSVARIMNNFSFFQLRIVGKIPEKEDYVLGVHSDFILDNAVVFPTLAEAVADMDRVIALSRRSGKKKHVDYNPHRVAEIVHENSHLKTALVFGRETFGLTDEEADLCPLRCFIPANREFPSLNLAQAVTVVLYELYALPLSHQQDELSAEGNVIRDTVDYIIDTLHAVDYFKNGEDETLRNFWENLLYRGNITKPMSYKLKQMMNRIHLLIKGRGRGFKIEKD